MKTSEQGRKLIERNEGCVLKAYYDVVGVLTIGYGCTGRGVYAGQIITQEEADDMLSDRLANEFEPSVSSVGNTNQNQFDAMVSLAFNIGTGAFKGSSVVRLHKKGDFKGAAEAFLLWNKAGGKILAALTRRRQEERSLYLSIPQTFGLVVSPANSAQQRTLRLAVPPMSGDDVKELQEKLGITADSVFGTITQKALKNFQTLHNLISDGICGPKTWEKVEQNV